MASEPAGTAFPLTYDPALSGPNYAALDIRLTAGAAMSAPDGSAFGGIQGVRAGSPSPLVRISGTMVTVAAHMGWLCPWDGVNGSYTYVLPKPAQVAVPSTTGSYKIAVVLEDKAAGHGAGEQVTVQYYPGGKPDSQIEGLVVARVDNGAASDVAPVISQDATVRVGQLAQLQTIKAADGTRGVLADGTEYSCKSGVWKPSGMVVQRGTVGISANAIVGGAGWGGNVTYPKPFAANPVVWTNSQEPGYLTCAQKVTARGFRFSLRNVTPTPIGWDVFPEWFAYGVLA